MPIGFGTTWKYRLNRPLTLAEEEAKLDIKKQYSKTPHYNLSLLKINSTYAESVDRQYQDRGLIAMGMAIGLAFFLWAFLYLGYKLGWFAWILSITGISVAAFFFLWDAFNYTHYPIRFNRKNGMVYVWQQDGTVLKAPWDETYFTIMPAFENSTFAPKLVVGHLFDEDKKTVTNTYALGDYVSQFDPDEALKILFEFYRLYMEEGPEVAIQSTGEVPPFCLPPLDKERESFKFGWQVKTFENHTKSPILFLLMQIFLFPESIGRWIAMQTSTIPKWPQWVEDECAIDTDDPHVFDHSTNTTNIWGEPLDNAENLN